MSLSLSSLLNPSPDSDSAPPPPPNHETLPPIQYVQSPEHQYATSTRHAVSDREGDQSQWYGPETPSYAFPSNPYEQRPGSSGYHDAIQLPPPTPTAIGRKPSSPTLDQYHVASRSPEQRKQSMISPVQNGFTLPPIHSLVQKPASSHEQATTSPPDPSRAGEALTHATATSLIHNQGISQDRSSVAQLWQYKPPPPLQTSSTTAPDESISSPAVKKEASATPRPSSPPDSKAVASLKRENTSRNQSPLRESSIPVPTTEMSAPEPTIPKKRPAPTKKKGTATATNKKAPPAKKRKVEPKQRSVTPSSRTSKPFTVKTGSSKGTPANSSPAPSTRSQSAEADDEPYDDDEDMDDADPDSDDVYCICRKPDSGTFMIGCDGTCDDWFHGKCVSIEERDKNLIDKYICPNCTKAGVGKTTWKRICRRSGCRQAARVGKTKNGKDGSKYCSEECGVAYFREMMARTRGREDAAKHRNSRRKSSIVSTERPSIDYDLGARGGVLAAGELKSLVSSSKTAEDFKKLGEGVLSPPATPDSKSPNATKKEKEGEFTEAETQALSSITRQKDEARHKHQLLKDRMKFVTMAKQAASRTATEKELKPKEYCGYDSRLEWSDSQFSTWRNTKTGTQVFELETLATSDTDLTDPPSKYGVDEMQLDTSFEFEVCDRKKCARHLEWQKLAVDDVRFEMSDNGDRMRLLDREEKEIKERAALRAKAGLASGEGRVEVHGLGIDLEAGNAAVGKMEVPVGADVEGGVAVTGAVGAA